MRSVGSVDRQDNQGYWSSWRLGSSFPLQISLHFSFILFNSLLCPERRTIYDYWQMELAGHDQILTAFGLVLCGPPYWLAAGMAPQQVFCWLLDLIR